MRNRKRILVAEEDPMMPLVVSALEGYCIIEAFTLEQAERMILEDGIDLVLIGIHFDDSRAMELIKVVRADKSHRHTPILVHRLCHSEHSNLLRLSLGAMTSLHLVSKYLELEGDPNAKMRIREAVDEQLVKRSMYTR